jgi:hypothetical protein
MTHPDATPDTAKDPAAEDSSREVPDDSDRSDGVLDDVQDPDDAGR